MQPPASPQPSRSERAALLRRERAETGEALRIELRRAFPSLNDGEIAHLIDLARALNGYRRGLTPPRPAE
jgi:hypothetical protein